MKTAILVVTFLLLGATAAHAYPQFQLSWDTTCTGCHVSPDGGGILTENGESVSESLGWKSQSGAFMYGMNKPAWLALGGDVRMAAGVMRAAETAPAAFPMQIEASANATKGGFTLHAVGGFRSPQEGGNALHFLWSREHYVMWRSDPGTTTGVYVRVGRFQPTYGLRLAEHIVYTQKFGGRSLYTEAYGVGLSYVSHQFEAHATGFVHDPILDTAEKGDGGAAYAELRLGDHAAIGAETKYVTSDEQAKTYGGLTGKLYVPSVDLLFQAEAEVVRQHITVGAGDTNTQLVGQLLVSRKITDSTLLDLGLSHYTQDTRVKGLYRDAFDANVHWFVTPHLEGLATARLELYDLGGDPTAGWFLLQAHYRL